MHWLLVTLCVIQHSLAATELYLNADFEGSSFNGNWNCNGCTLTKSSDHYHGQHSGEISHRTHSSGIGQTVKVTPGHLYAYKGFIKLLNMSPGHMYHKVQVKIKYSLNGHAKYSLESRMLMLQKNFGWTEIGGDFRVPSGVHSVVWFINIEETDVVYLVDNMSLQEIPVDNNWKTKAQQRIQSLRKSTLTVNVTNPLSLDTSNMEIEVKQLSHSFAFGAAVGADMIVNSTLQKYQDFFYNNFEWGVLANALKWKIMQHSKNNIRIDRAMNAVNAMRSRGITVRGHNMFWSSEKHSPAWLHGMPHDQLLQEMHTRINGTLSHTRGKLAHWDVNNENLDNDYYERILRMPNITTNMFRWMHQVEPGVKLFLNDYNVVVSSSGTTAYKEQARRFKASKVPIYGVGIQSHFHSSHIDMAAVKYRLDKIAEAGLPMWITELSIIDTDNNKKADALEDVLTMYFSYPAIEGILLWGWWDRQTFDTRAIVNGDDAIPNAAATRYITLFKKSWTTHITQKLQHGLHLSCFHGNYVLNIKKNGRVIESQNFSIGPKGKRVAVALHGSSIMFSSEHLPVQKKGKLLNPFTPRALNGISIIKDKEIPL